MKAIYYLLPVICFFHLPARADVPDFAPADLVLGQPDFTSSDPGIPPTANNLGIPAAIFVHAASGKVFVVDQNNCRVLRYANAYALMNGAAAEAVIGQPDFTSGDANQGGTVAANTLADPFGVFVDDGGRLWVSDSSNHRILRYDNAVNLATDAPATVAIGQPDLMSDASGLDQFSLLAPSRIWVDQNDRLWVADSGNHRVLRFDNSSSLDSGAAASAVFGQPNFTTANPDTTQQDFSSPAGVAVDDSGRLWVADAGNNRVLRFDNAATLSSYPMADAVLGQSDFMTATAGFDETSLSFPFGVGIDGDRLWVVERDNNRVVRFENAAMKLDGEPADGLIGQPDFTITSAAVNRRKLSSPNHVFVGADGSVWTTETDARRVLRFRPPDRTLPVLRLKGKKRVRTTKRRVVFRGLAFDDRGVDRVEFKAGQGGFEEAKGRPTRWRIPVRLDPAKRRTVVKIRAFDVSGNRSRLIRAKVIQRR